MAPAAANQRRRDGWGTVLTRRKPTAPLPTLYFPHGGGPCFFMDRTLGPLDTWEPLRA